MHSDESISEIEVLPKPLKKRSGLEILFPHEPKRNSPAFNFYSALAGVAPSHLPILVPDLDEDDE